MIDALVAAADTRGVDKVLSAAAMTYVAGVASSAGYIVYLAIAGGHLEHHGFFAREIAGD